MRRETFPVSGPITLDFRFTAGDATIEAAETDEALVELEGLNEKGERVVEEARIELAGDRLTVDVDRKGGVRVYLGRGPEVRARIRIPTGSRLFSSSVSADVQASGRFAEADVKTVSGDVRIDDVDGRATFKTVSGDMVVERVGGEASLHAVSGDVVIREAGGGVEAKTVSGDLNLGALAGGRVSVSSVSGDVVLGVRPGAKVFMDMKSLSGKTTSELAVDDVPPEGAAATSLELRANSVSGDIRVVRAA
jgi:hypothetical protein